MPRVSNELGSQYWEPIANGPVSQVDLSSWTGVPVPTTIVASGTYTSNFIYADGNKLIGVGVTASNAGNLSIRRFLDTAGLYPVEAAPTPTALTAATPGVYLTPNDGKIFQSFQITLTNGAASTDTITSFVLLMNAS